MSIIGQTISHYRIKEKLGGGGMGVVYQAEDTRLGRQVAVKVLSEKYFDDNHARERFRREARAASALSHPHICVIHDIGEHEGQPFIAMEYLKGRTLKQVIGGKALSADRILEIGIQVSDALDAAHSQGIIHRDIKPANIFITDRGDAKVLDFGLAKLTGETQGATDSEASTRKSDTLTSPGTAMGTVSFMSPEQALGRPLDARTDLFSLGIVLYEMGTRNLPFRGDTSAETVDAILHKTPTSPIRVNPELPDELAHIIHKCLEKDPESRYQSAKDALVDLKRVQRDTISGESSTYPAVRWRPTRPWRKTAWIAASLAGLALAVAVWVFYWPASPKGPIRIRPLTTDGQLKGWPQLSPDGEQVVYAARVAPGNWDIFVQPIGEGTTPHRLPNSPGLDGFPVWSGDGTQFAFLRWTEEKATLYTMPAPFGGSERKVIDLEISPTFFSGLSWSRDGQWLAVAEQMENGRRSRIVLISPETAEKRILTNPPETFRGDSYPSFSPNGSEVVFARTGEAAINCDLWIQSLDGSEARRLTFEERGQISSPTWTPNGEEIVFGLAGEWGLGPLTRLYRIGVEGVTPEALAGVGRAAGLPCIRKDRLVFVERRSEGAEIWRIPGPNGKEERDPERIIYTNPSISDSQARVSPDGRKIVFASTRKGTLSIWRANADGSGLRHLSPSLGISGWPVWSSDGRWIAFGSNVEGNTDVFKVDLEGRAPTRLTNHPAADSGHYTWSHDDKWIYFTSGRSGEPQVWRVLAEGGEEEEDAIQITQNGGSNPHSSADGKYLYCWRPPGDLWQRAVAGGEEERILGGIPEGGLTRDLGKDRFYYGKNEGRKGFSIHSLDLKDGTETEVFRQESPVRLGSLGVAPDENWIYYSSYPTTSTSDIMLVENFH